MSQDALIGFGTRVMVGNGATPEVFTEIPGVAGDIDGPSTSRDSIEVTSHKMTNMYREYKPGLIDPGEIGLTMQYIAGDLTQASLREDFDAGTTRNWQVIFPDDYTIQFSGFLSDYSQTEPESEAITYALKIKITGPITEVV